MRYGNSRNVLKSKRHPEQSHALNQASFGDMGLDFDHLFEDVEGLTFLEAISHDRILKKYRAHYVLDCACGTGIQSIGLAQMGYEISASDISVRMLKELQSKARIKHIDIEAKRADFCDLEPWRGRQFDAVICSGNSLTLVNKPKDIRRALSSMVQVTKPGGVGIIGLHNYSRLKRENRMFHFRRISENQTEIIFDLRDFGKKRVQITYFFARFVGVQWRLRTFAKSYLSLAPRDLKNEMKKCGYRSVLLYDISGKKEFDDDEWVLAVGET